MSSWINAAINDSAVIYATAATGITDGAHKAVKFDQNGNIVLAGVGDLPIGILIGSTPSGVAEGDELAIQVKDIGYIVTAAEIRRGAPVTVGASGTGDNALSGDFILGFALADAAIADHLEIQITKSGHMV